MYWHTNVFIIPSILIFLQNIRKKEKKSALCKGTDVLGNRCI